MTEHGEAIAIGPGADRRRMSQLLDLEQCGQGPARRFTVERDRQLDHRRPELGELRAEKIQVGLLARFSLIDVDQHHRVTWPYRLDGAVS